MGTRFNLVLDAKDEVRNEALSREVTRILKTEEHFMSCFMEDAEVSVINRKAAHSAVVVSDHLAEILDACQYYFQATAGAFDAGLWHFDEATDLGDMGWKSVEWNSYNQQIAFKHSRTGIDLGGFGKGWAVEKVRSFLWEEGVEMAFISFGESTVATIGTHPLGECWPLTIQHPVSKVSILIELNGEALSVSGLKNRGDDHPKEGVAHIISPANHKVINEDNLVVVKTQSALTAEVISTAVMAANAHQRSVIFDNFPEASIYECVIGEPIFNRLL
jgi:thiamine biosynthesis lipoprotein